MLLPAHGGLGLAPSHSVLFILAILAATTLVEAQTASDSNSSSSSLPAFPLPITTNHRARDPSIIEYKNEYYLFATTGELEFYRASNLSGPWKRAGAVLDQAPSVIDKGDPWQPWAPTVVQNNGTFYCFYSVSTIDTRNSSIGVATSTSLETGAWTDRGAIINTVSGKYADVYPYNETNAIDPSVIIDPVGGQAWLTFGSYWSDLWQVPLSEDLLSVENAQQPNASHLSYNASFPAEEASWISFKSPYYYLWYSRGYCCGLELDDLPTAGTEYSLRVGRSLYISGPYLDKENVSLVDGGGTTIYGTNNGGQVYAPGSCGVLSQDSGPDILYYHYLNLSIGVSDGDAFLGYNYLDYDDGWPVVSSERYDDSNEQDLESVASHILSMFDSKHFSFLFTILWTLWLL